QAQRFRLRSTATAAKSPQHKDPRKQPASPHCISFAPTNTCCPYRKNPPPALLLRSLVHHLTADHGRHHFGLADPVRIDLKNILRDDDQVRELARFNRTFRFFPSPCIRRTA